MRIQPIVLPGMLMLFALGILIALGSWQLDRLVWKEGLMERAATRPDLPAVDLPPPGDWAAFTGAEDDPLVYRRVRLSGTYDGPDVAVFTVLSDTRGLYDGPGYWIMTPLRVEGSAARVLVNRGFVPDARYDGDPSAFPAPQGPVSIEAIVRESDTPSFATPAPEPGNRLYYLRNVVQIVDGEHLEGEIAPFTLDLAADPDAPEGVLPQAGETRFIFTNNHLSYALTWFGLAVVMVVVFIPFAVQRMRRAEG